MKDKPLYLLKLGGSVITNKNEMLTTKKETIERLAKEIAEAKKEKDFDLILVNGAGSFGHAPVKEYGVKKGIQDEKTRFGTTMVHLHVEDLNRTIWNELRKNNISAAPVHPMSFVVHNNWKIEKFETEQIELMLNNGIIPLLYGDMVMDKAQGASIISGDDIIPYLAKKFGAEKILLGTNTNGIFDKDPNKYSNVKQISLIDNSNYTSILESVGDSNSIDVTGGMKAKLQKTVEQAAGIRSLIFNAEKEGLTKRVLLGDEIGTIIDFKEVEK